MQELNEYNDAIYDCSSEGYADFAFIRKEDGYVLLYYGWIDENNHIKYTEVPEEPMHYILFRKPDDLETSEDIFAYNMELYEAEIEAGEENRDYHVISSNDMPSEISVVKMRNDLEKGDIHDN